MTTTIDNITSGKFLPHSAIDKGGCLNKVRAQTHPAFATQTDDFELPGKFEYFTNDSLERFNQNLQLMPSSWPYRHKKVVYSMNKQGYRCQDLDTVDWANSVVMFGCSELMGTGLADDERICYQLENLLNVPVINLGKNGTSVHFSFMNNIALFNKCKPLGVVNQWTELFRETSYGADKYVTALPDYTKYWTRKYNMMYKFFDFTIDDWEHNIMSTGLSFIEATRAMWDDRVAYAEATWNPVTATEAKCKYIEQIDDARDIYKGGNMFEDSIIGHLGPNTAKQYAEYYAEQLNL